jgi:D-lactate dehydrogenase
VAEFAFALLLAVSRKICLANSRVKEVGNFSQDGLTGFDLLGKTIGVIGTGRIGYHAAKIAKGFGMNIIAYDVLQNTKVAQEIGFVYKTLPEVLAESDVLTIHVPYNKDTHHLLNAENIKLIKHGAVLVNTARGGVIETEALLCAFASGQLAGAGLDVLEEEPATQNELGAVAGSSLSASSYRTVVANHALIDLPNVVITPHNAFNTKEAILRILDTTVENIRSFIEGNPKNKVA